MGSLKDTTDKVMGTTKEAIAEIIGDGKLHEEGKTQQQRNGVADKSEQSDIKPLGHLAKLT
jgi:uncharacterized protein YjbJ (UPF0337 family)